MATTHPVPDSVRRWLARPAPATSDADLLRRFAADGDEAAFAALVDRHGPMVLGVARRAAGEVGEVLAEGVEVHVPSEPGDGLELVAPVVSGEAAVDEAEHGASRAGVVDAARHGTVLKPLLT